PTPMTPISGLRNTVTLSWGRRRLRVIAAMNPALPPPRTATLATVDGNMDRSLGSALQTGNDQPRKAGQTSRLPRLRTFNVQRCWRPGGGGDALPSATR